ncbi:hypothetical protein DPMN_068543 [Dreissena polymorpha]|uniref:Uncharacterized protein n=1 Tax=Dreissena polymorpha TaxID=45954 RepID=A0A9D4BWQ3_DREPO|nr:hypothetical protein DPMN_068543 [Dreissena polymorpha]
MLKLPSRSSFCKDSGISFSQDSGISSQDSGISSKDSGISQDSSISSQDSGISKAQNPQSVNIFECERLRPFNKIKLAK